jgi:hypothetical protein
MSEVIGYAARTCQSATERETSSWTEVISLQESKPDTYATLFRVQDIHLRSNRARAEQESSSALVVDHV